MKIAIIGAAGTVGSCVAFTMVMNRLAEELVLIDSFEGALQGQWMDLSAVGAALGTTVIKGDYKDLPGSDIVIVAVGAPVNAKGSRLELLASSLPIIKSVAENINQYSPQAKVIMETNPVDPLNYAMYLLSHDKDRRKYVGYSFNDTLRFRMWAAEDLKASSRSVGGIVIGEHGNSQVMLFSTLSIEGKPVEVSEETKKRIRSRSPEIIKTFESLLPKRTPGWTSAYGTAMIVEAIKNDSKLEIPCNTVLHGEYGLEDMSTTVPVILGKNGIESVRVLPLTREEERELELSAQTLKPHMRVVEDFINNNPTL